MNFAGGLYHTIAFQCIVLKYPKEIALLSHETQRIGKIWNAQKLTREQLAFNIEQRCVLSFSLSKEQQLGTFYMNPYWLCPKTFVQISQFLLHLPQTPNHSALSHKYQALFSLNPSG
jgi:hypothetical protein